MIPSLPTSLSLLISALLIGAAVAAVTRILQETEIRDVLDRTRFTAAWVACSWCSGTWITAAIATLWFLDLGRPGIAGIAGLWFAVRVGGSSRREPSDVMTGVGSGGGPGGA